MLVAQFVRIHARASSSMSVAAVTGCRAPLPPRLLQPHAGLCPTAVAAACWTVPVAAAEAGMAIKIPSLKFQNLRIQNLNINNLKIKV